MIGGPAGAAIGGSLGGAVGQSMRGNNAADQMSASTAEANALQRYMYDTTRSDNMPFLQTGYKANDQISALIPQVMAGANFAQYQSDPAYQWQQNEAMRLGQNTAAARGGLYRGSTMKALQNNAQNIAKQDYGNWWNRQQQGTTNKVNLLNSIRSGGQAASGQIGSSGQNYANTVGNNTTSLGNALGANSIMQGNIFGDAANRMSSYFTGSGGGVGDTSNIFTNKGYTSNLLNGFSNNDVYWN
jgi:hypothetical protein